MSYTMRNVLIVLVTTTVIASHTSELHHDWPEGNVVASHGHYPYIFCTVTSAVFNSSEAAFIYRSQTPQHHHCHDVTSIWTMKNNQWLRHVDCAQSYDLGLVFTIFYYYGSNYFHLHIDMLIPLYSLFYHQKDHALIKAVFMPTVERIRLQEVAWDTVAFQDTSKYWMQTVQMITGKNTLIPLHRNIRGEGRNICFKKLHLGTPNVDFSDSKLIQGFIQFVKHYYQVGNNRKKMHRLAIDKRLGRRQILNLAELTKAVIPFIPVDLINFSEMSFKEQVVSMSKYSIFAALNGAGLMNALYLPPYAVAIQLVPYKSPLNFREYGTLLRCRGPYLEWHNSHAENHVEMDDHSNHPNTVVHVKEFTDLIKKAIELTQIDVIKDEL